MVAPERESLEMIVDVIRTIARRGPKRFYVLNTGVSTLRPLEPGKLFSRMVESRRPRM